MHEAVDFMDGLIKDQSFYSPLSPEPHADLSSSQFPLLP